MELTEAPVIARVQAELFGHNLTVHVIGYDRQLDCLGRTYYHENLIYIVQFFDNFDESERVLVHELTHLAFKLTCKSPMTRGLSDDEPAYSAEEVCEMMAFLAPAIYTCSRAIMNEIRPIINSINKH